MSAAPFCPIKWRTHYRQMNAHTPPRGSSGGVAAYYAELVALYQELLAELFQEQLRPGDVRRRPHLVNVMVALDRAPPETGDMLAEMPTVVMVEQRALTDLARIVLETLRAQDQLEEARRSKPYGDHRTSRWHVKQCVARARAAAREALQREQGTLPGMGEDGA